ncbi:MAG: hypothetical protein HY541_00980 [Deltaproteobacteria bacterium]|nr:hypothetical protein [Deltaproteobacteria bacterium]
MDKVTQEMATVCRADVDACFSDDNLAAGSILLDVDYRKRHLPGVALADESTKSFNAFIWDNPYLQIVFRSQVAVDESRVAADKAQVRADKAQVAADEAQVAADEAQMRNVVFSGTAGAVGLGVAAFGVSQFFVPEPFLTKIEGGLLVVAGLTLATFCAFNVYIDTPDEPVVTDAQNLQ